MAAAATERRPGATLRVRIEKLVAGGLGLARDAGQIVLVADATPGDLLDVRIVETHRGWLKARAERVIEPGPGRRTPPCPHAAACGGCTLQHLGYDAQVEAKLGILRESFARTGKLELPEPVRVHRSPEWGYRRRARFHVRRTRAGRTLLGFRAKDGREVVDVGPCPVLTPRLEQAIAALRAEVAARSSPPLELPVLDAEDGVVAGGRDGAAHVRVAGDRLRVEPDLFFQATAPLLDALVARTVELAGSGPRAWDLYAGVGLFALGLARRFESVVAVEGVTAAARLLEENACAAGLANVRAVAESVEDALEPLDAGALADAAVVADPPREGLSPRARAALLRLRPRVLVHVACDPVALARDAGVLVRGGFRLASVDLFDLFPQTHHVEAVALFVWAGL